MSDWCPNCGEIVDLLAIRHNCKAAGRSPRKQLLELWGLDDPALDAQEVVTEIMAERGFDARQLSAAEDDGMPSYDDR